MFSSRSLAVLLLLAPCAAVFPPFASLPPPPKILCLVYNKDSETLSAESCPPWKQGGYWTAPSCKATYQHGVLDIESLKCWWEDKETLKTTSPSCPATLDNPRKRSCRCRTDFCNSPNL